MATHRFWRCRLASLVAYVAHAQGPLEARDVKRHCHASDGAAPVSSVCAGAAARVGASAAHEDDVRAILDERGFSTRYDAVYVPRNNRKNINLGRARPLGGAMLHWGLAGDSVLSVGSSTSHLGVRCPGA